MTSVSDIRSGRRIYALALSRGRAETESSTKKDSEKELYGFTASKNKVVFEDA